MCIHGDKSQPERDWVLSGEYSVHCIFFQLVSYTEAFSSRRQPACWIRLFHKHDEGVDTEHKYSTIIVYILNEIIHSVSR